MKGLAAPMFRNNVYRESGYNTDIISALNSSFPLAVEQTKNVKFSGNDLYEKGRAIYNYIKGNVKYNKDSAGKQIIQLPSRLILDSRAGDCKSMALAAAAFMYNNGFNHVFLRYAGYEAGDNTPTHVYAVGKDSEGNTYIIDPVYKQYNKELKFSHKKDYPMKIEVLSGPPALTRYPAPMTLRDKNNGDIAALEKLKRNTRPGGVLNNVVSNAIARKGGRVAFMMYPAYQLEKYGKALTKHLGTKNILLNRLVRDELYLIKSGTFTGNIVTNYSQSITGIQEDIGKLSLKKLVKKVGKGLKKISPKAIFRGLKTVGLVVPRKAFLALVSVNARGIATRLSQLRSDQLKKLWVDRFGGRLSVLESAIRRGNKKRPLIGAGRRVKAIKGIGYIIDESIGAEAAGGAGAGGKSVDIGALISAAGPIIQIVISLLNKFGVKEPAEVSGAGVDANFSEAAGFAQDSKPGFAEYLEKGTEIAESLGIIPDRKLNSAEQKVNEALPGDDHTDIDEGGGSSFSVKPSLLIGAAVLVGVGIYASGSGKKNKLF
jgi:hypothetical protein